MHTFYYDHDILKLVNSIDKDEKTNVIHQAKKFVRRGDPLNCNCAKKTLHLASENFHRSKNILTHFTILFMKLNLFWQSINERYYFIEVTSQTFIFYLLDAAVSRSHIFSAKHFVNQVYTMLCKQEMVKDYFWTELLNVAVVRLRKILLTLRKFLRCVHPN